MNALAQTIGGNWCEQLVWTLLHSVWQVSVIGLAVSAALRIGKSARARSTACAAGLVAMAVSLPVTYLLVRTGHPSDPAIVAWDEAIKADNGTADARIEDAAGREKQSVRGELSNNSAAEVPQPSPAIDDHGLSNDGQRGFGHDRTRSHRGQPSRDGLASFQATLMRSTLR